MNIILHDRADQYDQEYQRVRAELVSRGSSLNEWLQANGIKRQAAYRALKGKAFGKKSIDLRARILRSIFQQAA